ncbi:MAG: 2TM domain-containing protein, partial [Flavobacteriaceae bacterium]|nr:2TM domain-containing protein [Flavobacteriaceae bacterium]
MKTEDYDIRFHRANRKVKQLKNFYASLLAYCIVIPFLAFVNWKTTSMPWVIFPAIGWGIGLLYLGMCAFNYHPFLGRN